MANPWDEFPDADERAATKGGNPWDEFEDAPPERPKVSGAESALRGAQQGLTLGFSDEIGGGLQALARKGYAALHPSVEVGDEYKDQVAAPVPEKSFVEMYREGRENEREANRRASADNPALYTAGEIGGGILPTLLPGGAAGVAGRLGQTVGTSAIQGGVAGLGGSEADLTQGDVVGALADTAKGAALGGATTGVLGGIGKVVGRGANAVQRAIGSQSDEASTYLAKKALGFERGTLRKVGEQKADDAARLARDMGLISSNADEMLANVNTLRQRTGANIGEMYQTIDHLGIQPDLETLATRIQNKMERGAGWANDVRSEPMKALSGMVERLQKQTGQPLSVQQLAEIKRGLNAYGGWNKPRVSVSDSNEAYREAAHEVSNYIDEIIEGAEHQLEGGAKEAFKNNKRIFGAMAALEDPLINKSAREAGNKLVGLTDTIVGSGVLGEVAQSLGEGQLAKAAVKAATGATAIAGKKAAEKYAPALGTHALNNVAQTLRTNPQAFGKWAGALTQAAQRGGNALAVSLFLLQQKDPEFRQTIQNQ